MWRYLVFILPLGLLLGAGCVVGNSQKSKVEDTALNDIPQVAEDSGADLPLAPGPEVYVDPTAPPANADQNNPAIQVNLKSGNFFFDPAVISAKPGQTVNVTVVDNSGFHTFVIDKIAFKTQLQDAQTFSFIAPAVPGDYPYYSDIGSNRELSMEGVLRVQ